MIKVFDRIKEISISTGSGNFKLEGALYGFRDFASVYTSGDYCYYAITHNNNYEIGSGQYVFDGSSHYLSRYPIASTNSDNLVNFTNGAKHVFVTYPAQYSVYSEATMNSGDVAIWSGPNSLSSSNKLSFTNNGISVNDLRVSGAFYDSFNSPGSSGQILVSNANGTDWKSLGEITGVDGVGASGYIARWIDADTISSGVLFDNGVNVGVGTWPTGASPTSKLWIAGGSSNTPGNELLLSLIGNNPEAYAPWSFRITTGAGSGVPLGALCIDTKSGGVDVNRLTINRQTGLVGIGTLNPAAGLHVVGFTPTLLLANQSGVNLFKRFQIVTNAYDESRSVTILAGQYDQNNNDLFIGGNRSDQYASTLIRFFTASALNTTTGTERARFDSAGNFGLGTISPTVRLDVAGTLEVKNGVNPQMFGLYNTYTSATSFENLLLQWASNEARIGTAIGGAGGAQRNLVLGSWNSGGTWSPTITFLPDATVQFANASGVRTALGLGTLATQSPTGTPDGTKFLRDDNSWQAVNLSAYLPLAGGTMTGALTITQATANTSVLTSTGYSLTGSNAQSLMDLSGTWNTSGTPTLIKANVTDTASNAASLLMDLQVGGSTKFRISKLGTARTLGGDLPSAGGVGATGLGMEFIYAGYGLGSDGNGYLTVVINTSQRVKLGTDGVRLINSGAFFWSSASQVNQNATSDLYLYRDAAGILAQHNGTNAQTLRVYNTYTSTTSFERGKLEWASNVFRIGTEKGNAGGSARAMEFQTDGATRLTIGTSGTVTSAETVSTPSGTTQTVNLDAGNHQTLDLGSASGTVTATLTVPSASSAGTLILLQGATVRNVTWTPSAGSIIWMGGEPTWSNDTANTSRIIAWRYNGTNLRLAPSEASV